MYIELWQATFGRAYDSNEVRSGLRPPSQEEAPSLILHSVPRESLKATLVLEIRWNDDRNFLAHGVDALTSHPDDGISQADEYGRGTAIAPKRFCFASASPRCAIAVRARSA